MTKGLAFLNKKSFHPSTFRNMEQVWKLEQKAEEEKRKIEELKKEREEERKQEELEKMVAVPSENLDLWIDQNFTRAQPKKPEVKKLGKGKGFKKLGSGIKKGKTNQKLEQQKTQIPKL